MVAANLKKQYEQLLFDNIPAVASIESGIRNVTWLLPGRFQDAEVASEGLYAVLRLVSSYHDTIVSKRLAPEHSLPPHPFTSAAAPSHTDKAASEAESASASATKSASSSTTGPARITPLLPPSSDHTRYTRYWQRSSIIYRKASRALSILGYVELLVEMLARKRGDRARWRVVVFIEAVKTFLRLVLVRLTRRPVLSHPTPYREYDVTTLPAELVSPTSATDPSSSSSSSSPPSKREPILPHLRGSALRTHLQPLLSAIPESHQPHPLTLLPELDGRGYVGEVLEGCAGLIHVLLLLRWSPTQPYLPLSLPTLSRPLLPFLLPLLMRLLARHLRRSLSPTAPGLSHPQLRSSHSARDAATPLLAEHYSAQDRAILAYFFFTGPMWIGWTRPKIMAWVERLERWPVLGLVGGFAGGYLPLVDDYYYYTSS